MKTRSASVKASCIHPHSEQVFDEGYQRDTNLTCTPAARDLYSICRLNSYMPTSAIARLRRWFLSIPETCKSSSTMTAGRSLSGLVLATMAEVADVAGHLCERWQYERASWLISFWLSYGFENLFACESVAVTFVSACSVSFSGLWDERMCIHRNRSLLF